MLWQIALATKHKVSTIHKCGSKFTRLFATPLQNTAASHKSRISTIPSTAPQSDLAKWPTIVNSFQPVVHLYKCDRLAIVVQVLNRATRAIKCILYHSNLQICRISKLFIRWPTKLNCSLDTIPSQYPASRTLQYLEDLLKKTYRSTR